LIAASIFVSSTLPTLFTVIHGYASSNEAKILSKSSSSAFDVHALHISIVTGSCDALASALIEGSSSRLPPCTLPTRARR
jgi:hypothetical protein